MNLVCNAFPFHMISDCGTKSLPSTSSGMDSPSSGTVSGESEMSTGCGTGVGQVPKPMIAAQVVQPDNNRVRTASKAMRITGKCLEGLTRRERIPASPIATLGIVSVGVGGDQ